MKHQRQFQTDRQRERAEIVHPGCPGHEESATYVARQLRRSRVRRQEANVHVPVLPVEVDAATLTQLTPQEQELRDGDIFTYSGSGDVSGTVVPTNDLVIPPRRRRAARPVAKRRLRTRARGAVHRADPARHLRRSRSRPTTPRPPATTRSSSSTRANPGRTDLLVGTLGNPKDIPVVGLSFDDGAARRAANAESAPPPGSPRNRGRPGARDRERHRRPATSKTKKNPDEVIVVGAHLDSVVAGAGDQRQRFRFGDDPGDSEADGGAQLDEEAGASRPLRLLGRGGARSAWAPSTT